MVYVLKWKTSLNGRLPSIEDNLLEIFRDFTFFLTLLHQFSCLIIMNSIKYCLEEQLNIVCYFSLYSMLSYIIYHIKSLVPSEISGLVVYVNESRQYFIYSLDQIGYMKIQLEIAAIWLKQSAMVNLADQLLAQLSQ